MDYLTLTYDIITVQDDMMNKKQKRNVKKLRKLTKAWRRAMQNTYGHHLTEPDPFDDRDQKSPLHATI